MDSSKPACATSSNQKRKAEYSMMVYCKRTKFMATYYRQDFSMPDSVIFYVAKNPKTAELYLKMVKTCKYFFVKNPIIVIPKLWAHYGGKWSSGRVILNLTKYNCKYWITSEIYAPAHGLVNQNIVSSIIPKLYRCDVKRLFLFHQIIFFNDLLLLISSAEWINFTNVIVKHADSSDVPLEDIVAIAIKAEEISFTEPIITSKTMKELTKLPNFSKFYHFVLYNLSEVYDIDAFYSYMKKNKHTKLSIDFNPQISDAFKNRLETIVDEILETEQFNYKPPIIKFAGLDIQKYTKFCQLYFSH
uniref:Uncharacterized protein n=1 Tax=Panagrolaimus sp. PS1159 TaxID=55785 RepID=A0AC35FNN1_9BILA